MQGSRCKKVLSFKPSVSRSPTCSKSLCVCQLAVRQQARVSQLLRGYEPGRSESSCGWRLGAGLRIISNRSYPTPRVAPLLSVANHPSGNAACRAPGPDDKCFSALTRADEETEYNLPSTLRRRGPFQTSGGHVLDLSQSRPAKSFGCAAWACPAEKLSCMPKP